MANQAVILGLDGISQTAKTAVYTSPCHDEPISGGPEGDPAVWVGRCPICDVALTRLNPATKLMEWLDGAAPSSPGPLRVITEAPAMVRVVAVLEKAAAAKERRTRQAKDRSGNQFGVG